MRLTITLDAETAHLLEALGVERKLKLASMAAQACVMAVRERWGSDRAAIERALRDAPKLDAGRRGKKTIAVYPASKTFREDFKRFTRTIAAYPTVEAFYGMLLAASCIEAPPPGADLMQRFMNVVEIGPGRAATRRVGSDRNMHEYVLTESGWKYVLPVGGVKGLPGILNSETLARLNRH